MFRKLSWNGGGEHPNNIYILFFFVTLFFVQSSYKWWVNMQWVISFSIRLLNSEKEAFELAFGTSVQIPWGLEYKQAYELLLKDISLLKSFGEKKVIYSEISFSKSIYIYIYIYIYMYKFTVLKWNVFFAVCSHHCFRLNVWFKDASKAFPYYVCI